jgi:hypothetical protein
MKPGDRVKVTAGRRTGQYGVIQAVTDGPADTVLYYVGFEDDVSAEGDNYPDAYWLFGRNVVSADEADKII